MTAVGKGCAGAGVGTDAGGAAGGIAMGGCGAITAGRDADTGGTTGGMGAGRVVVSLDNREEYVVICLRWRLCRCVGRLLPSTLTM